ncbi:MAG: HIT family protein [Xanthomonadaceae bacterium]|nr:HIT family protein [Xanthomonadaceae bacterium]
MTDFALDPRLAADTLAVRTLALCDLRLMNDARYPWLVLVPRRAGMVELLDLDDSDQLLLYDEVRACARALQTVCAPDKLNIATLGNVVAQLHVHVIARFRNDDAWPRPVWGVHPAVAYQDDIAESLVARLNAALVALPMGSDSNSDPC